MRAGRGVNEIPGSRSACFAAAPFQTSASALASHHSPCYIVSSPITPDTGSTQGKPARRNIPVLAVLAIISITLLIGVVIEWVRSYHGSNYAGWATVRKSTPNVLVTDACNLTYRRGEAWFGITRMTILAPFGFRGDQAELRKMVLDVFQGLDALSPPPRKFAGFGHASGIALLPPLTFDIRGILVPCWFLALLTSVVLGIWLRRSIFRCRKSK